jgi:hypothetical protein
MSYKIIIERPDGSQLHLAEVAATLVHGSEEPGKVLKQESELFFDCATEQEVRGTNG